MSNHYDAYCIYDIDLGVDKCQSDTINQKPYYVNSCLHVKNAILFFTQMKDSKYTLRGHTNQNILILTLKAYDLFQNGIYHNR